MNFYQDTTRGLFGRTKITFTIPTYQRAYSWEEAQLHTFLEDLLEHHSVGQNNPYCYGNVLLETISENKKYEIIDGQQRMTTISIFIRSLLNVLQDYCKNGEVLEKSDGEPFSFEEEEDVFFKNYGVIKLRPTEYDRGCYDTVIIDNQDSYPCQTPSQRRILFAKTYFTKELQLLEPKTLIDILETVENAVVNRIELIGKKESALLFELQNNRGKDLTNLEKLKSFLMYQLYVYSNPDETEANIEYVSNHFNSIYNIVNQMSVQIISDEDNMSADSVNEDSILIYHSYAYSKKNFNYRNLTDIEEEIKNQSVENKVIWIKNYALTLYTSFSSVNSVLKMEDYYLDRLKKMKMPYFVYPFIIKGFHNKQSLPKLFRLMEVLSFRYKLVNSRSDIRGKLNELIRNFDGDVDKLSVDMQSKMNESYYWGDKKILEVLEGNMYKNNAINYFLWEYENELQRKGYIISGDVKIENESIEHISPQTEDTEEISSGYDVGEDGLYSQEFRDNYVNKLGNLMIISQSHNSSIGNKPFAVKLESYKSNPILRQQAQIAEFVTKENGTDKWLKDSIDNRHKAMVEFAKKRWSFIEV